MATRSLSFRHNTQEHSDKEDVVNTRREETTIYATVLAVAFLDCDACNACVDSDSRVFTGDAACSSCCRCFRFFCFFCCRRLTAPGMCTLSGTLSSSKELLTSAAGGIGGCGAAACFELLALVGCFDLFGELVGGESAERVQSQYGLTLSAASAAYVKHEITFKIGLRIAADRGGNPRTQYEYSTHTVRIPRGSRRIEHPPRSAASVRRCERGINENVVIQYNSHIRQLAHLYHAIGAGLTIVPVVPWEGPPPLGAPDQLQNFSHAVLILNV